MIEIDDSARDVVLAPGAMLLGGFARPFEAALIAEVRAIARTRAVPSSDHAGWSPDVGGDDQLRQRSAGSAISAATVMTPLIRTLAEPWPAMPDVFVALARDAAAKTGFMDFRPDACLINRYEPGAKLSLHQDKDELDLDAPIVSVSLGLPAIFQFGGFKRSDRPERHRLKHGDVVVWGGPSRLAFHGVLPLADGEHPLLGRQRINLTFRKTR